MVKQASLAWLLGNQGILDPDIPHLAKTCRLQLQSAMDELSIRFSKSFHRACLRPCFEVTLQGWAEAGCVGLQMDKIVGRGAPEEFVRELAEVAANHHGALSVDCVRAYHAGTRYMVHP